MNKSIFRKVALDRLSSPEQLDMALRITSPKSWLALAGLFLILGAAVVWGYRGTISTKVFGQAVIVRMGGVLNVVSPAAGMIIELDIKPDDMIDANQVIARVAQPALLERIRSTEEALAEAHGERDRTHQVRRDAARLEVAAIERERENTTREIQEAQDQAEIVRQRIPVEEELLKKGLITRQQVLNTQQELVAIGARTEQLRARIKQLEAQEFSAESRPEETDAVMQARIANLMRTLAGLQKELDLATNIATPYGGEVLEVRVYRGDAVSAGEAIASIQPDVKDLEVLAYVPSAKVKSIQVDMLVEISPSTVKREEYGFMQGIVTYVSDYPSTAAALMRNFENESLVQSIMAGGPVTEVRVTLEPDPGTSSGYRWSSPKGPEVVISSGTLSTVQIVTREQRPVSLLFPILKENLGLN